MSRWARLCGIVVGAVFLVAAWGKIIDPPGFAQSIYHYHLVPEFLRHPMALVLPWLELGSGVALILSGLTNRPEVGAARWAMTLLLMFVFALSINLWRGNPVDCGCFGTTTPKAPLDALRSMRWTLLRDLALMAMLWPSLRKAP